MPSVPLNGRAVAFATSTVEVQAKSCCYYEQERAPSEAEFYKYASKMGYDNGYDMYIDDALRSKSEAARSHARTIIFAYLCGIDETYPLTGELLQTKHQTPYRWSRILRRARGVQWSYRQLRHSPFIPIARLRPVRTWHSPLLIV